MPEPEEKETKKMTRNRRRAAANEKKKSTQTYNNSDIATKQVHFGVGETTSASSGA